MQSNDYVSGLAVSPDGTQISFTRRRTAANRYSSWVIPAPLGGVPRACCRSGNSGTAVVSRRNADRLRPDRRTAWRCVGRRRCRWADARPCWSNAKARSTSTGRDGRATARYIYFNHGPQNFNIEPTRDVSRCCHRRGDRTRDRDRAARRVSILEQRRQRHWSTPPIRTRSISICGGATSRTGRDTRLTSGVGEYTHPSALERWPLPDRDRA